MPHYPGSPGHDDRGNRLPSVPRAVTLTSIWGDAGPPRKIIAWGWFLSALGLGGIVLTTFLMNGGTRYVSITSSVSILVLLAALIGCLVQLVSRKHRRSTRFPALLTATGRCGACAFNFIDAPRADDGCAVCPECGAAWHTDRFTMPGLDLRSKPLLLRSALLPGSALLSADDRGVPLDRPCRTFAAWARRSPRSLPNLDPLRAIATKAARWRLLVATVLVVAAWIGAGRALISLADTNPRSQIVVYAVGIAILGAAGLFLIAHAWRSEFRPRPFRHTILAHGVCPNCRYDLPKLEEARPTFDGATPCTRCGRAWFLYASMAPLTPVE